LSGLVTWVCKRALHAHKEDEARQRSIDESHCCSILCTICLDSGPDQQEFSDVIKRLEENGDVFEVSNRKHVIQLVKGNK
jgi:hypothetical protein